MKETFKLILSIFGVLSVLTIIFVRAGETGGESGAEQASKIIRSTTEGFNQILRTVTGASSKV